MPWDPGQLVLWLSREGYVCSLEAKDARLAYRRISETINAMLASDPHLEIRIEAQA